MVELADNITDSEGLVAGDHFNVERTVTTLDDARTVETAWMTVKDSKEDADSDATFQKKITSTDDADVGHITDTGSGTGDDRSATVLFRLQPSETRAVENSSYHFDIQIKLDDGTVRTPFAGKIRAEPDVTTTTT